MTPDELELINELAETDKNSAPAADAGAPESVETDKDDAGDGYPLAPGISAERATGYAVYDHTERRFVPGSVRTRKPTKAILEECEKSGGRLEVWRV